MSRTGRDQLLAASIFTASTYFELAAPAGAFQGGGAYTVGAIISTLSTTPSATNHIFGNISGNTGYALNVLAAGTVQSAVGNGAAVINSVSPASTLHSFQNRTMFVAFTALDAGGAGTLFINGVQVDQDTITTGTAPSTAALRVGLTAAGGSAATALNVHALFFHPVALTAAQVENVYSNIRITGDLFAAQATALDHVWSVNRNLALLDTTGVGTIASGTQWVSEGAGTATALTAVGAIPLANYGPPAWF